MRKKIDTLYKCRKQEEAKNELVILCPICWKKNNSEESQYNKTKVASLKGLVDIVLYDLFL